MRISFVALVAAIVLCAFHAEAASLRLQRHHATNMGVLLFPSASPWNQEFDEFEVVITGNFRLPEVPPGSSLDYPFVTQFMNQVVTPGRGGTGFNQELATLYGLRITDAELAPGRIRQRYASWFRQGEPISLPSGVLLGQGTYERKKYLSFAASVTMYRDGRFVDSAYIIYGPEPAAASLAGIALLGGYGLGRRR